MRWIMALISLPDDVKRIISALEKRGFEAYIVGGCVRDALLGRKPDDWDLTTSARPEEIKALFPRTIDTGIKHGTVTVLIGRNTYEVTTYRTDGIYEDGRHPTSVTFVPNLEEDLKRRDFTINAMAYNMDKGLVDLFGGKEDLRLGWIRCVGVPEERFGEDALRVLRAIRFSAQLGFRVEEQTYEAIRKLAPTIVKVSAERVQVELVKLLVSARPEVLEDMLKTGLARFILPEFEDLADRGLADRAIQVIRRLRPEKVLRLAGLYQDAAPLKSVPEKKVSGEEERRALAGEDAAARTAARTALRRLKFDNDTISKVSALALFHACRIEPDRRSVRKAAARMGTTIFPLWLELSRANSETEPSSKDSQTVLEKLDSLYASILEEGDCISLSGLAIGGRELLEAGIPRGPRIGETLEKLLDRVLEEPALNRREILLELVNEFK